MFKNRNTPPCQTALRFSMGPVTSRVSTLNKIGVDAEGGARNG